MTTQRVEDDEDDDAVVVKMFAAIKDAASAAVPEHVKHAAKKKVNAWRGISEHEALAREATSSAKWGPHGEELRAMARLTTQSGSAWRETIWRVLEERMRGCEGERWRQCYKALTCCEFLVAHGHERCAQDIKASGHLQRLMRFEYKDERGRDEGVNVREKAKKLLALVSDPEAVREARDKAERNRGKYSGMSSEQARNRSSSMSSSSFDGGNSSVSAASTTAGGGFGRSAYEAPTAPTASQWDQVRVPPVSSHAQRGEDASATTFAPAPTSAATTNKATTDDSSDDEDAARPNAAPKIIFRDVASPRPPTSAPAFSGAIPAFAPPPRAKNAATAAINYASGAPVAAAVPGMNAAPPAATSSIDDLLGGLAAPAPAVSAPAPAAAASPWAGLDMLAGGMASAPASMAQPHAAVDPFATAFSVAPPPVAPAAPPQQQQQQPFMGDFAFAPPPQHASATQMRPPPYAAHAPTPMVPSSDPFGLASFGKPSPTPHASASPKKSTKPIDALASLTADLGMSPNKSSSSSTPMSSFAGGSLI